MTVAAPRREPVTGRPGEDVTGSRPERAHAAVADRAGAPAGR